MIEEKCQNCKYFLPVDKERGFCRRFPATVLLVKSNEVEVTPGEMENQISSSSNFPVMMNVGWCGEWKQRETTH